jgi:hypothetical protein
MQLTPLGFVAQAEEFLKEALALPPVGGGSWAFQRTVNLHEHSGSLQVILQQPSGNRRTRAVLQARLTGGPRDAGIQGWTEFDASEERDMFVLRQNDSVYACEEVFDIVDRLLARIPEWDNNVRVERPVAPPPKPKAAFAPLIPQIQKIEPVAAPEPELAVEPEAAAGDGATSAQAFVDSLLSPDAFEEPPAVESAVAEEPPAVVEKPAAKKAAKPAAKGKPGRKSSK